MKKAGEDGEKFRDRIARVSHEKSSRTILAIDVNSGPAEKGLSWSLDLLAKTHPYLCGVKLGRQTVLNLGVAKTVRLIHKAHKSDFPCIIDDKINDIGETNRAIGEAYFRMGFDAIIANPFAGWKEGLEPLFQAARRAGKGVILLVYMSHPGADESYGQRVMTEGHSKRQFVTFAEKAVRWRADGAVVGATRPEIVKAARQVLGRRVPIYSPGVGKQGGTVREALKAGADYLIIGRSIWQSDDPEKAALEFAKQSIAS